MSGETDHTDISEDSTEHSQIPIFLENSAQKDDIMSMLDKIENHVELIRRRAFEIEEERDFMFTTLHAFRHSRAVDNLPAVDRDDVDRYVDRIFDRCSTIELTVRTIRDKPQEDALNKINEMIDKLVVELREDPTSSKKRCLAFMNSCTSYDASGIEDQIFERALLGCTVDDQKRVRWRLQGLLNYMEKMNFSP